MNFHLGNNYKYLLSLLYLNIIIMHMLLMGNIKYTKIWLTLDNNILNH